MAGVECGRSALCERLGTEWVATPECSQVLWEELMLFTFAVIETLLCWGWRPADEGVVGVVKSDEGETS